jgi:hypothetical protein
MIGLRALSLIAGALCTPGSSPLGFTIISVILRFFRFRHAHL